MNIFRKGLRKFVQLLGENRILPPSIIIQLLHTIELSRIPNLKNPKDINEKIMWMLLNTNTDVWSLLADKYEVREYITKMGFENILVPLIGVYNSRDVINFHNLPDSFVVKSTNGSGQTLIVRDKSQIDEVRIYESFRKWFSKPFGLSSGETHYLKIKPRIIIEELIKSKTGELPLDYKFYCFNGKVYACLIFSERDIEKEKYKINMFDPHTWEEIPDSILPHYHGENSNISRPQELSEMIKVAESLSRGFPFVRIDLYNEKNKIYFGEFTFTPAACRTPYMTRNMLNYFGKLLE